MHLACILYNLMLRNSDLFFSKRSRTKQSFFIQTTDNSSLCLSVCLFLMQESRYDFYTGYGSRIIDYIWPKTYCISMTVYHLCFVTFLWNTASKKIIYIISVKDGLSFTDFSDLWICTHVRLCPHAHTHTLWLFTQHEHTPTWACIHSNHLSQTKCSSRNGILGTLCSIVRSWHKNVQGVWYCEIHEWHFSPNYYKFVTPYVLILFKGNTWKGFH